MKRSHWTERGYGARPRYGATAADDQDPCGRTSPESYAATAA
jgi:hypothetical protein